MAEPLESEDRTATSLSLLAYAIVVGGIVVRFLPRSGLWLDEALSVNIAGLPLGEIPGALRHDGHPPLYYTLLHFWMLVFGDSDWAVRAMSGVISTLTIPAAYLAGRRLAIRRDSQLGDPNRVGLVAMALIAAMPFAIRYGAEARMYSLVMLLVLVGYLTVDSLVLDPDGPTTSQHRAAPNDSHGRRQAPMVIAAAVITAALLWTHYWTAWLIGAVGILALTMQWTRRKSGSRRIAWRGPIGLIIALCIGAFAFVPWLPTMSFQAAHTGTPWGEQFGPFATVVITVVDFSGARFGAAQFLSYVLVTFIIGAAVISVRQRGHSLGDGTTNRPTVEAPSELVVTSSIAPRIRPELIVIVITLGVGWLTARLSGNTYSSRYGAVVFPLFVLSVAAGISLIRRNRPTVIALAVVALLCTYGSLGSALADRSQVGSLVDAIEADIRNHDLRSGVMVVVCPDQLAVATQRQVDQRPTLEAMVGDVIAFPDTGDPRFVDWVDYSERNADASPVEFVDQIEARAGGLSTVYLIMSTQYRTLEGKCEGVADALVAGRRQSLLEPMDTSGLDEAAELRVFRPGA